MDKSDETPFPEAISGFRVIEGHRVPSRPGELPEQAFMIGKDTGRAEDRAYIVWDAAVRDGKWTAFSGHYDMPYEDAVDEFSQRIRVRLASIY